ncbi:transmembrane protein 184C-like [Xenia sp. Carnegie-2017]|uniref:transmembrane protein 184C-like n=1 Tax=Xenia sp. Carnegie-2017 TaxID=2897299 RepID=UPI001F043A21|nr:transmembrane protein 184C-like [Xenia sp. Carnegie-2017]
MALPSCFNSWRVWLKPLAVIVYILLLCISVPLCIWELHNRRARTHTQACFIGAIFMFFTIGFAIAGIIQHLLNYTKPHLQKYILRILWMVPIYSVTSWLALRFPEAAIYLDSVRECYEAFVILSFLAYLLSYLHAEHEDFERVMESKPQVHHLFPICCLPDWKMGREFIENCKHGVMSYTVVRIATTFVAFVTELSGHYNEGDFDFKSAWSYVVIITNFSQMWALYCLVIFYKATRKELQPIKPFGKFLCIKMVVFATFWQAALIGILVKAEVISSVKTWEFHDVEDVSTGIQNFCVCVEMFIAAVAHYYVFSHTPFVDPDAPSYPCWASFRSMIDMSDVREDMTEHVLVVGRSVKDTVLRTIPRKANESERRRLLDDNNTGNTIPVINDMHAVDRTTTTDFSCQTENGLEDDNR